MPLVNKLKELRVKNNMNQQELAQSCNVSRQTISSIERGDYHPSIYLALKICRILNVKVEEIFELEGE